MCVNCFEAVFMKLFRLAAEVKIRQGNQGCAYDQQKGDGIDHRRAAVSDLKIQIDRQGRLVSHQKKRGVEVFE